MSTPTGARPASTSTTTSTSSTTCYSVPHQLFGEQLDVRVTATMIDIYRRGTRVYVHRRSFAVGGFTTIPEHMPKAHRAHLEWSPTRLINWGATIGPQTAALVSAILESRRHPEQGYRSCLGLLRLSKRYPTDRAGSGLCAGAARRRPLLPLGDEHPQARPGPHRPRRPTRPVSPCPCTRTCAAPTSTDP